MKGDKNNTEKDQAGKGITEGKVSLLSIEANAFIKHEKEGSVQYISVNDDIIYEDYESALNAARQKKELETENVLPAAHSEEEAERNTDLINVIVSYLKQKVKLEDEEEYVQLAIYCVLTYCYRMFDRVPYINISGPKGTGKTTLMQAMKSIVYNPQLFSNITEAAIFRVISEDDPTLLLDEAEKFGGGSRQNQGIFQIINSGYQKDGKVARVIKGKAVEFSTFGPKILGAINRLAPTIEDRCLMINMTAPQNGNFRPSGDDIADRNMAEKIKLLISGWIKDNAKMVYHLTSRKGEIAMNPFIRNRDYDKWFPIIVLSHLLSSTGHNYEKMMNDYARLKIVKKKEEVDNLPENACKKHIVEFVKSNEGDQTKILKKDKLFYYVSAEEFTLYVSEKDRVNSYTGQGDVTRALKRAGINATRQRFGYISKNKFPNPIIVYRMPVELVDEVTLDNEDDFDNE